MTTKRDWRIAGITAALVPGVVSFLLVSLAHQRVQQAKEKQQALVAVLEDRKRLAYARYEGDLDAQLNALDADRDLLQAKLDLRQIELSELLSVVQLYKSLGGGWRS